MESERNVKIPWPGWTLGRRLGGGGFGTVYEIERDLFGVRERDAMKVIRIPRDAAELESDYSNGMTEEEIQRKYDFFRQMMVDEYKQMLEFRGHSNIVNCHDFAVVPNANQPGCTVYIRMELLTPLNAALEKERFSEERIIRLGIDICQALALLGQKNMIHRDIKPENIMMSASGSFKLGDFGLARTLEQTMSATRSGTTWYMAPEVIKKMPYGRSVDTYSLGLVLYQLLNGYRLPFVPFKEKVNAKDMDQAFRLRVQGNAIPEPVMGSQGLKAIVLRAIAYERPNRFRTADEMLQALRALEASAQNAAPNAAQPTPNAAQSAPRAAQPTPRAAQPAPRAVEPAPRAAQLEPKSIQPACWNTEKDGILGIYLDTREIDVRMWSDGEVRPILKLPAYFITTATDETLAGKRAANYKRCHMEEKAYSVLEMMRYAQRSGNASNREYAQACCLALMQNLRDQLAQTPYGGIEDCVVAVSAPSLPLFQSLKAAMEEAGFHVKRTLTASVACLLSHTYDQKQSRPVKLCLTADGERQAALADGDKAFIYVLENRIVLSRDQESDWAKAEQHVEHADMRFLSDTDEMSHMELVSEAARGAAIQGANLSGQLNQSGQGFVLLDLFPWRLGLDVVDANGAVCCPLTWIAWSGDEQQPTIPANASLLLPLNAGVRGKTLRLYAGDAASGQDKRAAFSANILQEWAMSDVCSHFRSEPKRLEVRLDLYVEMTEIRLEIKNPDTGEKASIRCLQSKQKKPAFSPILSAHVPGAVIKELGEVVERFRAKAEAPLERGTEPAIRQGTLQIARQSTELLCAYSESRAEIRTDAFIEGILPIADNLGYALKAARKARCTKEHSLLLAFYIHLQRVLHRLGLQEIEALGMPFNPRVHEAMMTDYIEGVEKDMVIDEIQTGYMKDGKVFRPAKVTVTRDLFSIRSLYDSDVDMYS